MTKQIYKSMHTQGPQMLSEALKPYNRNGPKIHWISNVDGAHVEETLETLNPETPLFIISSKVQLLLYDNLECSFIYWYVA